VSSLSQRPLWQSRALAVIFGVSLGAIVVVAAEVGLRMIRGPVDADPTQAATKAYQAWASGPCYRIAGDRLQRVLPPQGAGMGSASPESGFSLVKQLGVRRIAIVGESTAEMLERALKELVDGAGCGDRAEILQCSASGSLPGVAVQRAEEVLAYSPDAIVVAIGHNFLLPGPPAQFELALSQTRLGQEVAQRLPARATPRAPNEPPVLDSRDPPAMGREAYRQILRMAQTKGVKVVAVVLASNLWFRPKASGEYVTSPQRTLAWVKWARGDLDGAIAALQPSDGRDDALRAFERATFHAQKQAWRSTRQELERARDLEPASVRASSATTAAITQAARDGGATTIDVDALFSPLAEHGIPGWDVFFDNCHPYPEPLNLLARTVLKATVQDQTCPTSLMALTGLKDQGDAYRRLIEGPFRVLLPDDSNTDALGWRTYPDNGAWRRLIDGPFTAVLRLAPRDAQSIFERYDREMLASYNSKARAAILHAMGLAARDAGRLDLAHWSLERSTSIEPAAPVLVDLALIQLREHQEAAARESVERSLQLEPANLQARAFLEVLQQRSQSVGDQPMAHR